VVRIGKITSVGKHVLRNAGDLDAADLRQKRRRVRRVADAEADV
jgi:hypothetical protein